MIHSDALQNYLANVGWKDHPRLKRLRDESRGVAGGGFLIRPESGNLLGLLTEMIQAKKILEIGCFTGYSALVMALHSPDDAQITSVDINPEWTKVARRHWQEAGFEKKIELVLKPGVDHMNGLLAAGHSQTFDLLFIDADKKNYPNYLDLGLKLLRRGGLLILDNTLWKGKVFSQDETAPPAAVATDETTQMFQNLNLKIASINECSFALIPIGDGLTVIHKR